MLTEAQLRTLQTHPGLGWISALRCPAIRELIDSGTLQPSLFDQPHLAEITAPEYPGERLIACFNPLLADERRRKREELLVATERALTRLATAAARRTKRPFDDATLGVKVGRVINHYKVARSTSATIAKGRLQWTRNAAAIEHERQLDGIYVIRTSEAADRLSAADGPLGARVPVLKGIDVRVRPIFHRTEDLVRALNALCHFLWTADGLTNAQLRPLVASLLGTPYSTRHMGYDLRRLVRKGLVKRLDQQKRYVLIPMVVGSRSF
jgi:hypothetical protein